MPPHRLLGGRGDGGDRDGLGDIRGAQWGGDRLQTITRKQRLARRQPIQGGRERAARRPDIVVFVNGLPVGVLELKNAAGENATVWTASTNCRLIRPTSPRSLLQRGARRLRRNRGAGRERSPPGGSGSSRGARSKGRRWRTRTCQVETVIKGDFDRSVSSTCSATSSSLRTMARQITKKLAGYHQYHAVKVAVKETCAPPIAARDDRVERQWGGYEAGSSPGGTGDRRVGVVWHTQGSGKSLTMAFYAGRITRAGDGESHPRRLTDRNDLDDQLFGTFSAAGLLRQTPVQAETATTPANCCRSRPAASSSPPSRSSSRKTRRTPPDAHRSPQRRRDRRRSAPQPVRLYRRLRPPYARCACPTPRSRLHRHADRVRRQHARRLRRLLSVYDIQRAVEDGATVPSTTRAGWPSWRSMKRAAEIDADFEEATEGEEGRKESSRQMGAAGGRGRRGRAHEAGRRRYRSTSRSVRRRSTARR